MNLGKLITFEGFDRTGKSTQLELVKDWLTKQDIPVLMTRQPGGTSAGEVIRKLILSGSCSLDPKAALLLMMADRAQHVAEVILPALEQGMVVLCDRFVDSSVAYQGYGMGLDLELIDQLNKWTTQQLIPVLTVLFDRPVDFSFGGERPGDRIESRDRAFQERVRQGFLALYRREPQRIVRVDVVNKSPEEIFAEVRPVIARALGLSDAS